jgi:hypothetical protein
MAVGAIAQGGLAIGLSARGGMTRGHSTLINHFNWLLGGFPPTPAGMLRAYLCALGPPLIFGALICLIAMLRHNGEDPDH